MRSLDTDLSRVFHGTRHDLRSIRPAVFDLHCSLEELNAYIHRSGLVHLGRDDGSPETCTGHRIGETCIRALPTQASKAT